MMRGMSAGRLSRVNPTHVVSSFQSSHNEDDYASIAETDALLFLAGDPAPEDEAMRKGTCFQVSPVFLSPAEEQL